MSKVYPFSAYDQYMSLKLDSNMWLIMVYFLRPFILKVSTIQMGRGTKSDTVSGLKDLVYPNDFGFFLAFVATVPVLMLIFAYAKRKPEAADYVRTIWRNGRKLLVAAAVLNVIIIFVPFLIHLTHSINVYGWGQLAVAIGIIVYLYQSKRVTDTFADFPKESDDDLNKR
jgi:phosphoglycerol transferase MdoB-like AlkP superfamily enzyme